MGEWLVDIRVLDQNPLYKDATYRLKFRFPKSYPIGKEAPASSTCAGADGDGNWQNPQRLFSRNCRNDLCRCIRTSTLTV